MSMQRRQFLGAAITGAVTASMISGCATKAEATAAAPVFEKPTAEKPLIACFNENPLGLSPAAQKAVAESAAKCNRYPFVRAEEFRAMVAKQIGGKKEEIVLSQGSAEAIRASVEAYVKKPGAALVVAELSYSDGEMAATRNGIPVVKVKMGPNWSMDIPAMREAAAKVAKKGFAIVYFVNPNNPTSTIADSEALFDWIRSNPKNTIFLVDEAYGEFVDDKSFRSTMELVAAGQKNVIVLKTFSKIYAMAGLRLGYAYAAADTAKLVHDHIAYDFFQNVPALEAAISEMNDAEFLKQSRDENAESRKIMEDLFKELNLEYLPSQTNFCFFNLKAPLKQFADAMKAEHIMVGRPFPPATEWCRISYVRPAEMRYVADVMRGLRAKGVL
ncbi:histidinol-phosphate transaminase [Sutterella sp.]|uniref:pyridoxal phosphate-dependent aminotransferase n=1 Tax=Sutterella sp. TaxID=1981025 RepID=UPI0026DFDDB2|nr:aminotransferase class I/II-fold pyridoxal phosphate-dependent enzyme [Sutterella sp.]MDO5532159.1 aminotransferase class I/II-fold pyridoxal phosphate-dependent enzyme [Sutterella sp.]